MVITVTRRARARVCVCIDSNRIECFVFFFVLYSRVGIETFSREFINAIATRSRE